MKVILIGAGRLATNLGKALLEAGHDILQVYSRTMESASALATLAGGAPVTEIEKVRKDADVYIISVKDSVLPDLVQALCSGRSTKVFLHTAGSVNMDVFAWRFIMVFSILCSRSRKSRRFLSMIFPVS